MLCSYRRTTSRTSTTSRTEDSHSYSKEEMYVRLLHHVGRTSERAGCAEGS